MISLGNRVEGINLDFGWKINDLLIKKESNDLFYLHSKNEPLFPHEVEQ